MPWLMIFLETLYLYFHIQSHCTHHIHIEKVIFIPSHLYKKKEKKKKNITFEAKTIYEHVYEKRLNFIFLI